MTSTKIPTTQLPGALLLALAALEKVLSTENLEISKMEEYSPALEASKKLAESVSRNHNAGQHLGQQLWNSLLKCVLDRESDLRSLVRVLLKVLMNSRVISQHRAEIEEAEEANRVLVLKLSQDENVKDALSPEVRQDLESILKNLADVRTEEIIDQEDETEIVTEQEADSSEGGPLIEEVPRHRENTVNKWTLLLPVLAALLAFNAFGIHNIYQTVFELKHAQENNFVEYKLHEKQLEELRKTTGELLTMAREITSYFDPETAQKLLRGSPPGKAEDCVEWYTVFSQRLSGVYRISPKGTTREFLVYCDMVTDGGGWTVILNRGEYGLAEDFFDKTWNEYKNGFGDLDKEFWLGNDYLSILTSSHPHELMVEMWESDDKYVYAKYDSFRVENESKGYQLSVGSYSGTAGAALEYHNGMKFSTKDRDNDLSTTNCAVLTGGWWYNKCYYAHLTGLNRRQSNREKVDNSGIVWLSPKEQTYLPVRAQMKIRTRKH